MTMTHTISIGRSVNPLTPSASTCSRGAHEADPTLGHGNVKSILQRTYILVVCVCARELGFTGHASWGNLCHLLLNSRGDSGKLAIHSFFLFLFLLQPCHLIILSYQFCSFHCPLPILFVVTTCVDCRLCSPLLFGIQ